MARNKGLTKVTFDGSEALPSSKFSLIIDILKKRISDEQETYSVDEIKEATQLMLMADNFQLLCISQDSPIHSTQNDENITTSANTLMLQVQKPLKLVELPPEEQIKYKTAVNTLQSETCMRDNLCDQFATGELFINSVDYISQFSLTCLLGISNSVRKDLENLSDFNRLLSQRFNQMVSLDDDDCNEENTRKFQYILDYTDKLIIFHNERYPMLANHRNGDYEGIYDRNIMETE